MKEDIEHVFNSILLENEISIGGCFFKVRDKILTCNCILNNKIIILLPKITKQDDEKIKEFKKIHTQYKIIVFTEDKENVLLLKSVDEIYTMSEKKNFIRFIKDNI